MASGLHWPDQDRTYFGKHHLQMVDCVLVSVQAQQLAVPAVVVLVQEPASRRGCEQSRMHNRVVAIGLWNSNPKPVTNP